MLERHGMGFPDARVSISGSGNVAQYAAVKSMELGARVVTLSDSEGTLVVEQGLSDAQLAALMEWKNEQRGRLSVFATRHRSEEHTSELQSLMRISYAVFCLKTKTTKLQRTMT